MQLLAVTLLTCISADLILAISPPGLPLGSVPHRRQNGTCKSPALRKEWRALSKAEKKNYLDAINCLAKQPNAPNLNITGANPDLQPRNTSSSLYDDFVYVHMDGLEALHVTGRFYPWHRLFLNTFETHLKQTCGFTGALPYWDFTQDSADILKSTAFDADPQTGLGAWPTSKTNFEVRTGAFSNFVRAYPSPHQIIRNYTAQPYLNPGVKFPFDYADPALFANSTQTPENWKKIVTGSTGNFTAFQLSVDGHRLQGVHPSTHVSAGGPEGDVTNLATSPSDPLFFLLHAQLDRLWWEWQTNHPSNFHAISGGETQDLVNVDLYPTGTGTPVTANTTIFQCGLAEDKKIGDVFDIMGGFLCYKYQ